jgi:flagellar biosynthesis anti-sigma factor FlgM
MRIDKNGLDAGAIDNQRTRSVQGGSTSQVRSTAQPSSRIDQVDLSSGAALASAAIKAAEAAPDVRPDLVARAKAMLEAGEVGNDPGSLADALIDGVLQNE